MPVDTSTSSQHSVSYLHFIPKLIKVYLLSFANDVGYHKKLYFLLKHDHSLLLTHSLIIGNSR